MNKPILSIIAAMDENGLIGNNNKLPWQLPADLQFFKRTTMGKPIVMGRKTFASIGKALPGRRNIVVSRNAAFTAEGCEVVADVAQLIALVQNEEEVMIIGGASFYEQLLPKADRLYFTRIHATFAGDAWFPKFDANDWEEVMREDCQPDEKNLVPYSFVTYVRKPALSPP